MARALNGDSYGRNTLALQAEMNRFNTLRLTPLGENSS